MGSSLYRFAPVDFRQRATLGPCEEVADWPYSYDDLEPYYCLAERELGVSGDGRSYPFAGSRSQEYPMPPLRPNAMAASLDEACARLGLSSFPTPRAINSVLYQGRPACRHCKFCAGFGCPTGARGTAQETLLAKAELTGRACVLDRCFAWRITTQRGRAYGCIYFDPEMREHRVRARVVCVCCSAVESARLLLLSASPEFPDGLANRSGLVGRHLQFHSVSGGVARFQNHSSRNALSRDANYFLNRSIMDFYIADEGALPYRKGGLLRFDLVRIQPIVSALRAARQDRGRMLWGRDLARSIDAAFHEYQEVEFEVFHDFLPNSRTWVSLDPEVCDKWGLPVARMQQGTVAHHALAGAWLVDRGLEILKEMGADDVRARSPFGDVSRVMIHGTCRAGADPAVSVLNEFCQSHDVPNLFVADGSFMPTSGGAPSTLTIIANALRVGDWISELARRGEI
jgi:choline dehydrogenase-like flavoprotein